MKDLILIVRFVFIAMFFTFLIAADGCDNRTSRSRVSAERIISLSPHITEIIYALEADHDLIAVSDYCRYPDGANSKEKIGGLINPNIEKIISLKPTMLIGVPSHLRLHEELAKFDLSVIMLPNENISDMLATIDSIGSLLQINDKSAILINSINDSLEQIKSDIISLKPRALLVIGRERGTLKNITAAGDDTFINELWEIAGGINLFDDLPSRYGSVSLEAIITRNPDVVIEFDIEGIPGVNKTEDSDPWKEISNVEAVTANRIYTISGNHTLIPGPRMVLLARQFRMIIDQLSPKK